MRGFVVSAALAAALAGGIARAQERSVEALQGEWNVDVDRTFEGFSKSPHFAGMSAEEKAEFEKGVKEHLAGMTCVFAESSMTIREEGDEPDVADLAILSHEGTKWTIQTKERLAEGEALGEGEEPPEPETFSLEWQDDDHVVLTKEGDDVAIHLVRKK